MNTNRGYKILLVSGTLLFLYLFITDLISLNTGSYIYRYSDLHKIDSVKLLDRAFFAGGRSGKRIQFNDENNKTFRISGSSYSAIIDKDSLYDTLQYSNSIMT